VDTWLPARNALPCLRSVCAARRTLWAE
jgi:hypothetical protein